MKFVFYDKCEEVLLANCRTCFDAEKTESNAHVHNLLQMYGSIHRFSAYCPLTVSFTAVGDSDVQFSKKQHSNSFAGSYYSVIQDKGVPSVV